MVEFGDHMWDRFFRYKEAFKGCKGKDILYGASKSLKKVVKLPILPEVQWETPVPVP